jgi:hypothetical protein
MFAMPTTMAVFGLVVLFGVTDAIPITVPVVSVLYFIA